jgi:hypothetical protein
VVHRHLRVRVRTCTDGRDLTGRAGHPTLPLVWSQQAERLRLRAFVVSHSFIGMLGTYCIPTGIRFGGVPFSFGVPYPRKHLGNGPQLNPASDVESEFVWNIVAYMISARAVAFALAYVHITMQRCAAAKTGSYTSLRALLPLFARLLICVGLHALGAYFAFQIYYRDDGGPFSTWFANAMDVLGLEGWHVFTASDGSPLVDCLFQVAPVASCINEPQLGQAFPGGSCSSQTWMNGEPYPPFNTSLNLPGWSTDPLSPAFYDIHGIGAYTAATVITTGMNDYTGGSYASYDYDGPCYPPTDASSTSSGGVASSYDDGSPPSPAEPPPTDHSSASSGASYDASMG